MSAKGTSEVAELVERVRQWPPSTRFLLIRQILETLEQPTPPIQSEKRQGLSSAEIAAMFKTDKAPPDDETVKQWIDEHRMEKYGK